MDGCMGIEAYWGGCFSYSSLDFFFQGVMKSGLIGSLMDAGGVRRSGR